MCYYSTNIIQQRVQWKIDYTKGPGTFIGTEESDRLYEQGYDYMIQVDDDKFFAAIGENELEEADFLNHSCDPNCGTKGSLRIVAMRDIEVQLSQNNIHR